MKGKGTRDVGDSLRDGCHGNTIKWRTQKGAIQWKRADKLLRMREWTWALRLETLSVFLWCATLLYLSSLVQDFADRESGVKRDKKIRSNVSLDGSSRLTRFTQVGHVLGSTSPIYCSLISEIVLWLCWLTVIVFH